ncbi:MAG: hypothetical protein WC674_11975 [Candidatus Krumholzibacteriia bacterium]
MQLYPHWLDGEFVRIASNTAAPGFIQETIRAMKLHALLGTQFILNDVQVFDSAAVLALFADDALYDFVRRDRGFLDLRVEPDPSLGDSPFALAARGFTRTRAPGWISSVFMNDSTPIKRLADEIIANVQAKGYVDLECPSRTAKNYPQYAKELNAASRAVHYFGSQDKPHKMVAVPGERTNYYQVLYDLLGKLDEVAGEVCQLSKVSEGIRSMLLAQVHEDFAHVEDTINFIDKEIEDPEARKARSRVLAILGHEADLAKREWIWNNVVQAWNYATQKTLQPEGGSVGTLPGAMSPAPYLESPTDILVPVELENLAGPMVGVADLPILPIDIDEIGWAKIAEAREATADTMEQLTRARHAGNIDALSQPLREHLVAVGRILQPPKKVSKVPYVLTIGTYVAGQVVMAGFGDQTLKNYMIPLVTAGIMNAGRIGGDIWRDTAPWRQRRALTNTLFRAAKGKAI